MTKRITPLLMILFLIGIFTLPAARVPQAQQAQLSHTFLKVGDVAPDFKLRSDQGTTVQLSDYRGKKTVVLAFYVLAFTGG
jgi:cytochrome oxidase Cu insertion factor (SCO1/SenC/PrrC family)